MAKIHEYTRKLPGDITGTEVIVVADVDDSNRTKSIELGDVINEIGGGTFVNRYVSTVKATAGQVTFTTPTSYTSLDQVDVYLRGIKLIRTDDYTSSGSTTIDLVLAATLDDDVEIIVWK